MQTSLSKVEAFKTQLAKLGCDYICTTRLPDTSASVAFLGQLQGQIVIWNMTLATLAHYRKEKINDVSAAAQAHYHCPFIEIKEGIEGVYSLKVGLDLAVIDEPVIKKAIIMMRNYKRLVIGRIEFAATDT